MRTLLVGLVVALMATTAYGYAGHLTMSVGGANPYTPAPGETFRVTVDIQADTNMASWGMQLRDEADAGYTIAASVDYYELATENYADAIGPPPFLLPFNQQGWEVHPSNTKLWDAGLVNQDPPVRPGTAAVATPPGASSGFVLWFDLTAPATEAGVNTRIVLDDLYAGDLDYQPLDMTSEPLVLPEPASALLLLGGLPLLRRRR